jgi:hypothetical protein
LQRQFYLYEELNMAVRFSRVAPVVAALAVVSLTACEVNMPASHAANPPPVVIQQPAPPATVVTPSGGAVVVQPQ